MAVKSDKKPKRKVLRPHVVQKKDKWGDDRKEQINLGMGTSSYREFVRDQQGIESDDFVLKQNKFDHGDDKRPDEQQDNPPEEVVSREAILAEELREAAVRKQAEVIAVNNRKYRRRMSKEVQIPELRHEAVEHVVEEAEESGSKDYNRREMKKAKGIRDVSDIPDPIYDDGISAAEFIPLSMRKYF